MAACMAMPAAAQSTVRSFPKPLDLKTIRAKQAQQPFHAPSKIDDAQKGLPMYVGEVTAYDRKRGWAKFYSGNVYNSFTRLKIYNEAWESYQVYGMRCGAWTGEKYYAYITNIYGGSGISWENPAEFVEIDPATGEKTILHEYDESEIEGWPTMYDMLYDHKYETLYALGQGTDDDGNGVTEVYTVDAEDGSYTLVNTFDKIYYNMAIDYDGNWYGVTPIYTKASDGSESITGSSLEKLDENFGVVSSVAITDWDAAFVMGGLTTMGFDYTTGDLWWLPLDSYYSQKVVRLDTATGVMDDNYGSFWGGYQFAGLYIPYLTADSREAAGQVSDIDAQADVNGAMADTLRWTNPVLTWNRDTLTELAEVQVYRKKATGTSNELSSTEEILSEDNAELVATVTGAEVGKSMQWVDTNPNAGINTYYVVPCRVSGEKGVLDSVRCHMGVDVPAEVQNIQLAQEGEHIRVTWEAPTHGVNNGYVNPAEITYTLTRMPDSIVVATDIADTTLLDLEPLGETQQYYYYIQGSNKAGKGATAKSYSILAGAPIEPPAELTITSYDESQRWTSIDANADYSNFYYSTYIYFNDTYHTGFALYAYNAADDWVVSPALRLKAGHSYCFVPNFVTYYPNAPFNVQTAVGKGTTVADMTPLMRDDSDLSGTGYDNKWTFEDFFTPEEDGVYYYGFHVNSTSYDQYFFLGLTITEVFDNDLSALSIGGIVEAVAGTENNCTVNVRNTGKNEQSAYKVKILCNGEVVGETTDVPAVKMGETVAVPMTFTPTEEGPSDFVAVVELEGDQNADNDTSAVLTLDVQPAGTLPFTNIVTGDGENTGTNVPCSWYSSSEVSQSLYLADEIGAPEAGDIVRMGYEYESNSNLTDRMAETNVTIYMANTDKSEYAFVDNGDWTYSSTDWVTFDQFTKVYEGTITVEPGTGKMVSFNLDTPFAYDRTKNLAVFVMRDGAVDSNLCWPVLWSVYNQYGSWTDYDKEMRSLYARTAYTDGMSTMYQENYVPVLYLAFDNATGINRVGNTAEGVNFANGKLTFGKNITSAQIYDISGKLLRNYNVAAGSNNVAPSLSKGVYVVRTKDINGKAQSVKLSIAK